MEKRKKKMIFPHPGPALHYLCLMTLTLLVVRKKEIPEKLSKRLKRPNRDKVNHVFKLIESCHILLKDKLTNKTYFFRKLCQLNNFHHLFADRLSNSQA